MLCMLGFHHVYREKIREIHKTFVSLVGRSLEARTCAVEFCVLFFIWMSPVRMWWSSVVSRMSYWALCFCCTFGYFYSGIVVCVFS